MSACRAADSDRVDNALDPLPSTTQSSTPPTRRRRRRRPFGLGDALPYQRAATSVRDVRFRCPSARAVVPTTWGRTGRVRRHPARASPLPLLTEADRGGSAAASTHRCEPTRPLPGRSAGDQAAPALEDRLVGVRAGGARSVGSISVRGRRIATPISARRAADSDRVGYALDASPSTTQSSTPPTCCRRRPRPLGLGEAPHCQRAATPVRGVTCRCASARVVSPRHGDGQAACADARHGRRPSSSSTGPTVAALPPQARIAASLSGPFRGHALVTRQRPPQKAVS